MDGVDIGEIELKHEELGGNLEKAVDMYREALNVMQIDVQQVVEGLFLVLKRQVDDLDVKSRGKYHSTQHRIKLLKSLHKNMLEMEQAFAELKGRYPDVMNEDEYSLEADFRKPTESTDSVDDEF